MENQADFYVRLPSNVDPAAIYIKSGRCTRLQSAIGMSAICFCVFMLKYTLFVEAPIVPLIVTNILDDNYEHVLDGDDLDMDVELVLSPSIDLESATDIELVELNEQHQRRLRQFCGGANWTKARQLIATDEIPVLQVHGGKYLRRQTHWIEKVCTPTSGPECSHQEMWRAEDVVLCIDGEFFSTATMHTRGHTSAIMPKHQFSIGLTHQRIIQKKGRIVLVQRRAVAEFLGLPSDSKWVLGISFVDTSFIRNQLSFLVYQLLGAWAPRYRFVNLLFQVRKRLQTGYWILHNAYPLHTAHCTPHTAHCTPHTLQTAHHTPHKTHTTHLARPTPHHTLHHTPHTTPHTTTHHTLLLPLYANILFASAGTGLWAVRHQRACRALAKSGLV